MTEDFYCRFRRVVRCKRALVVWVLGAACLLSGGCTETRVTGTRGWWDDPGDLRGAEEKKPGFFESLFKPKSKIDVGEWTILIAQFEEPTHAAEAARLKKALEAKTGYQDLWLQNEGERTSLYAGHYQGAKDSRANADALRWKQMQLSGQLPSSGVVMTPIIERNTGSTPEWNLLNARSRGDATLEIGYFDEEYGPRFREIAEQYVAELRLDHHEAYYYHGPNQSGVTVGIFWKAENPVKMLNRGELLVYGPKVEALRRTAPFNVRSGNGRVVRERTPSGVMRDQPSLLVEIPSY